MADKTEVNYEQLANIIKRLQAEADAITQLHTQTKSRVDSLHNNGWIGRGSDQFFTEMEQLILPAVTRLAGALQIAAQKASEISKIYRNAEEQGQGVFKALGD